MHMLLYADFLFLPAEISKMLEALQINLDITVKIIFFQSRFLKWFLVLAHHLRRHAEAPLVAAAMVIPHK